MEQSIKAPNQMGMVAKTMEGKAAAVADKDKPKTLKDYVAIMEGEFAKALPKVMTPERFTRIALSALSSTPALMDCTRSSFLGALMQAAQLGLEPNTPLGQAYLIPFKNNKKGITECQFQIGYKGMLDLCYRSGEVRSVQAHIVYESDTFNYSLGLEDKLEHIPAVSNRGKAIYVYGVFKLKNGGYGFEVMSMDDVKGHAEKYSKAFKFGPWQDNFEEMAKKAIIKKVLKYAPIRSDFITVDSTVSAYDNKTNDVEITSADIVVEGEYTINTETGEAVKTEGDAVQE